MDRLDGLKNIFIMIIVIALHLSEGTASDWGQSSGNGKGPGAPLEASRPWNGYHYAAIEHADDDQRRSNQVIMIDGTSSRLASDILDVSR